MLFLQAPPRRLGALVNIRISTLSCNSCVAMFLADDGTLYSYGNDAASRYGLLGLGEVYQQATPHPLRALFDHRIRGVSVGYSHVCAVNSLGHIFAWGTGKKGQLGIRGAERKTTPTRVDSARGIKCRDAVCSYNYTAIVAGS